MKIYCELCKLPARIYCESDQARLCWSCDAKVHAANFLVARHSRILLCHACQSPTPWKASGSKLCRTVSVCESCVGGDRGGRGSDEDKESEGCNDNEFAAETDDDGYDEKVVPRSSTVPPPASSSSSSSEESSVEGDRVSRIGEDDSDLYSQINLHRPLSKRKCDSASGTTLAGESSAGDGGVISDDSFRTLKGRRIKADQPEYSGSVSINDPVFCSR